MIKSLLSKLKKNNNFGIYPIHYKIGEEKSSHNALEIKEAINNSMLPVLFVEGEIEIVPCMIDRVVSHSDNIESYEFSGFTSWSGKMLWAIDCDGKTFLPK